MIDKLFLTLFASMIVLFAFPVSAIEITDSAWVMPRNSNYLEWQLGYGQGTQDQNVLQDFSFRNHLEMGFLQQTNLILEWPYLTRSLKQTGQDPEYLINNGFTDLYLGSRIQILNSDTNPFALAIQPGLEIPIGYNPSFSPVIGNAQMNVGLDLVAGFDFFPIEGYSILGLGYRLSSDFPKDHVLLSEQKALDNEIVRPADRIRFFAESGFWLSPQLFSSLKFEGLIGLSQAASLQQSQIVLKPTLAWRIHPNVDISLQSQHSLWNQNSPALHQLFLGVHIRTGPGLERSLGLRGSEVGYATFDPNLP